MEVAIAAKEATVIRVEDLLAGARQRARTEEAAHAQTLAELQASHRRGERLEAEMRAVAAEASTVRSCFFEEVRKADRSLAAAKEASILAAGQAEAELALCTRGVLGAELAEADAVLHDVTAALASVSKAAADAADRGRAAAQRRAREAESSNGTFTDDSLRVLYRRLKQEATAAIVAAAEDATAQCRVAVAALANEKAANKADRRELELAESRVAAERDRAAAAVNGERDAHKAAAAAATACAAAEARAAEIESRLEQAIEDADGARATISRLVASLASKLDAAVAGEGSLEAMVSGTVAAIDNHQLQVRTPIRSSRPIASRTPSHSYATRIPPLPTFYPGGGGAPSSGVAQSGDQVGMGLPCGYSCHSQPGPVVFTAKHVHVGPVLPNPARR